MKNVQKPPKTAWQPRLVFVQNPRQRRC